MELFFTTREEWHEWLDKNHSSQNETWLVYYKKASGKPRISYGDALEEALCYGWIDGKIKKVNEEYYIQRFTPRRRGSRWSQTNIEKVKKLINEGRMMGAGLKAFEEIRDKPHLVYNTRTRGELVIPPDLIAELNKNSIASDNFGRFPGSARQLYIRWLEDAKRPETRQRRIVKIVGFAEKNIRPGML